MPRRAPRDGRVWTAACVQRTRRAQTRPFPTEARCAPRDALPRASCPRPRQDHAPAFWGVGHMVEGCRVPSFGFGVQGFGLKRSKTLTFVSVI